MPYYRPDTLRYTFAPPDRGLLAETMPAHMANSNTVPATAGRLEFARIRLPAPASVTNIVMVVVTVGNTLTAGQNFAALYTSAGVLVGVTADQAAAWVAGGIKTMALASGPFTCAAGDYYVGFWYNGTTSPAWLRCSNVGSSAVNVGVAAPNLHFGFADTGLTTTPPSPMGAQTAAGVSWYAALS